MDRLLVIAGQILLSEGLTSEILLKAFGILENEDYNPCSLVRLCTEAKDWQTSSRISQAASIRSGGKDILLITTSNLLLEIKSPWVLMGLVLGIFKATNWYDNEWKIRTDFCNLLPLIIYRFIVCQSETAKNTASVIGKIYENEISASVKQYVRSDKEAWQKPARLIHVSRILKNVREDFNSEKLTLDTLSPLGALILDQILYALFGHVSVSGRMYAMAYLMNEHIDELAGKAKSK